VVMRERKENKPGIDPGSMAPRYLRWFCTGLAAYGFIVLFVGGRVSYRPGDPLPSGKAATFYGSMISFFAIALLFHAGLSVKKAPNQSPEPTPSGRGPS